MRSIIWAVGRALLVGLAAALPAPHPAPAPSPTASFSFNPIAGLTKGIEDQIASIASQLASTQPTKTPDSIPDAVSTLQDIFGPKPTGIITIGLKFLTSGLQVDGLDGTTLDSPPVPGNINSFNNTNPAPPTAVFPQANPADPPFTKSEDELRSAIFIPDTFQGMGNDTVKPILLVPGTGTFGGVTYQGNMIKILQENPSIGQAVWLNVPGAMLDDVQTNAEFIAYAMNYIASLTGTQVSVVGWSQGNLAAQWALKYWTSARTSTKQLVAFSPDFRGTIIADAFDLPLLDAIPVPPAVLQQQSTSNLIRTLRATGEGGDSAFVPTTTLYSAVFDEVVQPQEGTIASAFLRDDRGAGVSNNEIQSVCPGTPAGDFATHESMLFNGLATALALDALQSGGVADPGRLDLAAVCAELAHPALDVADVAETEGTIPLAALNALEFRPGVTAEPAIRAYAL
ncbi:hypothetical protein F5Y15DRAFT_413082 [Xylariaceae sp. FL0016]|nr:hypothetical protein F5Y15DRAFT_413082 [Xylariaceae sp. FL0016]